MDQQSELEAKRREISQELFVFKDKTSPTSIVQFFRGLLPDNITAEPILFAVMIFVILNLLMWIPGLITSLILDEFPWRREMWFGLTVGTQTCASAVLISYFAIQSAFYELKTEVVNKITKVNDLEDFLRWVHWSWKRTNVVITMLLISSIWVFLSLRGFMPIIGGFYGYGPLVTTTIGGILLGLSAFYIVWVILLSRKLAEYRYEVNAFTPSRSEIIDILANIFNKHLYIASGYFAVSTLVASLIKLVSFIFPLILLCWIMLIFQYLSGRFAISKIINSSKWATLNKLQAQINQLTISEDLSEKEPAEKLLRLTDIYGRIAESRVNTFDLKSISAFVSQLMLPLLGLLLGNIDKVIALLR